MIIFDLDGTLANCEHRRWFVEPFAYLCDGTNRPVDVNAEPFKPDWQAFYEACDKDEPIQPVIDIFKRYWDSGISINIWSGRCESVREKTLKWLSENISISYFKPYKWFDENLKMRPIGDKTPDDGLKERWLDESCLTVNELSGGIQQHEHSIEFVFDDRPKVIRMWRRRGIFVFNCAQSDGEF